MKDFKLNRETLRSIHNLTGMDGLAIAGTDVSEIDAYIEKRNGKRLTPAVTIGNLASRGSVYLMFKRFFLQEEINTQLDKIKP